MQINKFDGGLNTRLSPHLIAQNQSPRCENVDTSRGALVPIRQSKELNVDVKGSIHKFKDVWVNSETDRDYVEFQDKLFYSDGVEAGKWSSDGYNFYDIVIKPPKIPLVATASGDISFVKTSIVTQKYLLYRDGWQPLTPDQAHRGMSLVTIAGPYMKGQNLQWPYGRTYNFVFRVDHNKYREMKVVVDVGRDLHVYREDLGFQWTTSTLYNPNTVWVCGKQKGDKGKYRKILLASPINPNYFKPVKLLIPQFHEEMDTDMFKWNRGDVHKYVAVWISNEDSSKFKVEMFEQKITYEEDELCFGVKIEKVENYRLILYRNGKLCNLLEKEDGYYDHDHTLPESVDKYTSYIKYVYTYYNSKTGSESSASEITKVNFEATSNFVSLDVVASEDPQVDKIRIYRMGVNETIFDLIAEVNNKNTTVSDELGERTKNNPLKTVGNRLPERVKYMTSHNWMLFVSLGDTLFYSNSGHPFVWGTYNFIKFEGEITGIGSTPNGLMVFLKSKTFVITGESPSNFSVFKVSDTVGCVFHKSVKPLANQLAWLAEDGFYTSNGGQVANISRTVIKTDHLQNPVSAAVLGELYIISYKEGSMLMDLRFGFSFMPMSEKFKSITTADGKLYGAAENNKLVELFAGEFASARYFTPVYSDGSLSKMKIFSTVYVYSEGEATIKIFIDGKEVLTSPVVEGFNQINLPQSGIRGYTIQFDIETAHPLLEIEYKIEERQNGR